MKGDDEDDEEANIGVSRYPCMPSLVALQQMRNRLHLAHLGKKLMKWTALATGKELRKIALEMSVVSKNFGEDCINAFIVLARARYFFPDLNMLVLENAPQFPKEAKVRVGTTVKSITGVKVLQFELRNNGQDSYSCLALGKGGQAVNEAKRVWYELLMDMVMILQLKKSFVSAEISHKGATKKMNVLSKVVIPRTRMTIEYILLEIEEMARDELHRIKMVKKNKVTTFQLKQTDDEICCKNMTIKINSSKNDFDIIMVIEDILARVKKSLNDLDPQVNLLNQVTSTLNNDSQKSSETTKVVQDFVKFAQNTTNTIEGRVDISNAVEKEHIKKIKQHISVLKQIIAEENQGRRNDQNSIKQIDGIMSIMEDYKRRGVVKKSVEDFLKAGYYLKTILKQKTGDKISKNKEMQPQVNKVKQITKDLSQNEKNPSTSSKIVSSSMETKKAESLVTHVDKIKNKIEKETSTENLSSESLSHNIQKVITKNKEVLRPYFNSKSLDTFVKECEDFENAIRSEIHKGNKDDDINNLPSNYKKSQSFKRNKLNIKTQLTERPSRVKFKRSSQDRTSLDGFQKSNHESDSSSHFSKYKPKSHKKANLRDTVKRYYSEPEFKQDSLSQDSSYEIFGEQRHYLRFLSDSNQSDDDDDVTCSRSCACNKLQPSQKTSQSLQKGKPKYKKDNPSCYTCLDVEQPEELLKEICRTESRQTVASLFFPP